MSFGMRTELSCENGSVVNVINAICAEA